MSSEDIDKGARWSTDISHELEDSEYGVLCVTPDNLQSAWLNFEAGALSKSFDRARVSPFLFGLQRTDVPPNSPLLQFQSTIFEKMDVFKLVHSINKSRGDDALASALVDEAVEIWWPKLHEKLNPLLSLATVASESGDSPARSPERQADDVLAEILELVRAQQRLLSAPDDFLPPAYVEAVLAERTKGRLPEVVLHDLSNYWRRLHRIIQRVDPEHVDAAEATQIIDLIDELEAPVETILRRYRPPAPRRGQVTLETLIEQGE